MTPERLDFYRTLLTERLQALLRPTSQALGELSEQREVLTPSELLTTDTNKDFALLLQERERALVRKIRDAIGRIDEGSYGVCVACGASIGERRLMARPMATHCIDCKTEVDLTERRRPTL